MSKSGAAREIGLSRTEINEAMNADGGGRAERFPFPQWHTPHTGSPRWSKPVLREWMRERQRAHPEPVVEHLSRGKSHPDAEALLSGALSATWREVFKALTGHNTALPFPAWGPTSQRTAGRSTPAPRAAPAREWHPGSKSEAAELQAA